MKYIARKITFFLLVIFPAFAVNAAPQSFFITSGQVIENGTILRTYSLEISGDPLSAGNLAELTDIGGAVTVLYAGGREQDIDFGELVAGGKVALVPYDQSGILGFRFADAGIERITAGSEGIGFFP